jgi:probable HAF family extracellular repeat protein
MIDEQTRGRMTPAQTKGKTMKTDKLWLAALAAVTALTSAQAGEAPAPYTITDLGTLPGQPTSLVWESMLNNRGHVAVYTFDSTDWTGYYAASSFLWKGPKDIEVLPGLPGSDTIFAYGLNDRDQVVGCSGPTPEGSGTAYLAVLWEHGTVRSLGKPPWATDSGAALINNSGLVVGDACDYNQTPPPYSAVCWYHENIIVLPPLNDGILSQAWGVNEWGQIVGQSGDYDNQRAVLWSVFPNATVTDLGTLGGASSGANAINNWGQIVGSAQTASGDWHPALWCGRSVTDLQNFATDPAGAAFALNDRGQIVGWSVGDASDLSTAHALLWENGTMINLQTQIPANSGWLLGQACGINLGGQIAGFGLHHGKVRAFLLTPAR